MRDQIKELEEVVSSITGNEKFVLIGMLDLTVQLVEQVEELQKTVRNQQETIEQMMKGGGASGRSGGLSIG